MKNFLRFVCVFWNEMCIREGLLVGKRQPGQALSKAQNVPVSCEYHDGHLFLSKTVLELQVEVDVIDTRHVARAGRRGIFGVECEREDVDENIGNVAVVLVGLDEAEPRAGLVGEARLVVEVESRGDDRITVVNARVVEPVVATFLALTADTPHQFQHRVIEVQLHTYLGVGGLHVEGLVLRDEHFVVGGGEAITFNIVEVDVRGLEASRQVVGSKAAGRSGVLDLNVLTGDDDALFETFEFDVNLDTVELERSKSKSLARVLGEPEGKGNVKDAALTRVADELGAGVALANHFCEATSRLSGQFFPHEEEIVVKSVDGGATNDNTCTANEELANVVGPVSPDAVEFGAQVVGAVFDVVAAFERRTLAVLFAEPLVLGSLKKFNLGIAGGLGETVAKVFGDGSFVVLGARSARLVHVHGELVSRRDASALILVDIAGGDTRKINDNVHVIN